MNAITTAYRNLAAQALNPAASLSSGITAENRPVPADTFISSGSGAGAGSFVNDAQSASSSAPAASVAPSAGAISQDYSKLTPVEIKKAGEGYTVEASYIQVSEGPGAEARKFINTHLESDVSSIVSGFERNYAGNPPEKDMPANELSISMKEVTNNDRILSIDSTIYTYEGGAHGSCGIATYNFDVKTGCNISFRDLFNLEDASISDARLFIDHAGERKNRWKEVLTAISDYCIEDLKKQWNNDTSSYDEEWLKSGAGPKEENFNSFNLTEEGLLVHFGQYQVNCYADGMRDVKIPYEALEKYLDPKGPLAEHARPEPQKPEAEHERPQMELTDDMLIIDDVMLKRKKTAS